MTASLVQSKTATGTSATSLTVTLNSATTAGNCLIVCVGTGNAGPGSANATVSGITLGGSAGNFASANTAYNNSYSNAAIWADPNCAGGQTSVVISLTGSSGTAPSVVAWVMEWSGLAASSVLDKAPAGSSSSGTSWSSGSTGTLSQTAEVAVGVAYGGFTGATLSTPGSPWTELSQLQAVNTFTWTGGAGYQVTSAATALTYNGTWGSSQSYGTCIATFNQVTSTTHSGTATLSGTGTLTATGAFAGKATLAGSGTLSWSGSRIYKATVLSGSGTLSAHRLGIFGVSAALSGTGTLGISAPPAIDDETWAPLLDESGAALLNEAPGLVTHVSYAAALSGSGTLAVPGFTLGITTALSGTGTLTVIGTGGTVQASAGPSSPYARPGTSQVAVAPPGTTAWRYLAELGQVTALAYSFVFPGGADKLDATVAVPAAFRDQIQTPGWQVRVTRGGHIVWTGRMDEPVPSPSGWQFTAVGDGQRGQDFRAYFTSTWPSGEPDQAVNNAISRGLPWVNPGIGTPSGIWLGQAQDPASGTIADLLNLACTRGALGWYANSQPGGQPGTDLTVAPLPAAVNRILVVTDPVPRTLGGDINTIFIRYQITDASSDASGGSQQATYGTTTVQNAASAAAHGVTETYIDLSSAGVMSASAAQGVGNKVLASYQRASFAGPFTAAYGQLLNTGGSPVDPGTDQAGTVVRLILTDYAYGGEVTPAPVTFITGSYTWDDFAGKASITPYQALDQSLSGLLSMENTILTPITAQQ